MPAPLTLCAARHRFHGNDFRACPERRPFRCRCRVAHREMPDPGISVGWHKRLWHSFSASAVSKLFFSDTVMSINGTGATSGAIRLRLQARKRSCVSDQRPHAAQRNWTLGRSHWNHRTKRRQPDQSGATGTGVFALTPGSVGGVVALILDRQTIANSVTGVSSTGTLSNVITSSSTVTGNTTGLTLTGVQFFPKEQQH